METRDAVLNEGRNPIDACLGQAMTKLDHAGYGWILGSAKDAGGALNITVTPVPPPTDTYQPPAGYRTHCFHHHLSLIDYARKYGSHEKSVLFHDDVGLALVLDETVDVGDREVLRMPYRHSEAWSAWNRLLATRSHDYMTLRDELPILRHTMRDPGLILALRQIKYTEEFKVDSDIREEAGEATYGLVFSVKGAGESLKTIPRKIEISIPILDIDVTNDSAFVNIEVLVELVMPKRQGEPLKLLLLAPEWQEAKRLRLERLMSEVHTNLNHSTDTDAPEWLIVNGTFTEKPRVIGDPNRFKHLK